MKPTLLFLCSIFLFCFTSLSQEQDDWRGFIVSTTTSVNFREGPGTDYSTIKKLPKGTQLFIEEGSEINGFYPAILLSTDELGYVSSSYVRKTKTVNSEHGNLFNGIEFSGYHPPVVKVYNNTPYKISVSIGNSRVSIIPHATQEITCSSGMLKTIVSAPGVIPFMATDKLENNYTYSWTFYISTSTNRRRK